MRSFSLLLAFIALSAAPSAFAEDLRITTGGSTGTYIQIGRDIADVARSAGLAVEVSESQGSVLNIKRVLGFDLGPNPNQPQYFQLAIIQEDVLADLRLHAEAKPLLREIVDKVKVVMPLYQEEVHLFVRKDGPILALADVRNGAEIGAGQPGSGSYITTSLLMTLSGLTPTDSQLTPSGGSEGMELLDIEAIDMVVQVAGAPSKLGEDITPEQNVTLATIADDRLFAENSPYQRARVDSTTYPWLDGPVDTASVGSILVAYDYSETNPNCDKIERVTRAIIENLEKLQATSHPKWREVNPTAALASPYVSPCARRAFQ